MYTITTSRKTVSIFVCTEPGTPIIYLNTFVGEGQKVFEAAQAAGCPPFSLVAISNLDWNRDMAPWDGPAAFKNGDPFIGGANNYLQLLVEEIMPEAEKELNGPPKWRGNRRVFPSRTVRPVCHLPDGFVFPGGMHVRFSVVSWLQRVHLLPRAEALAGLHLLLLGGQGGQDPQSGSKNSSGEY